MSHKTAAIENIIRTGQDQISMQSSWLFVMFHANSCISKTGAGANPVFVFNFVAYRIRHRM